MVSDEGIEFYSKWQKFFSQPKIGTSKARRRAQRKAQKIFWVKTKTQRF
jgi:hypothetical protein